MVSGICRVAFFVTCLSGPLLAQLGDNLALLQPAMQSSQLGAFGPEIGVNGNLGDFTHTQAGADLPAAAWWEVDLGGEFDIGYVVLHNRTSCCGSRLRDIVLQIRDDFGEIVFGPDVDFDLEPVDTPELVEALDLGDDLRNPENVEGAFPLGPENISWNIEAANGGEPLPGRYLRVARLPDPDNSGTGGQGNPDESTVLQVGEFEVFETAPSCPAEGDTHCDGEPEVVPPLDNGVGNWSVTTFHVDDTGDPLTYTFTAEHEGGGVVTVVSDLSTVLLNLQQPGEWTIRVTADDSAVCEDVADDVECVTTVNVEASATLTTDLGLVRTKAFSVLGPFSHDIACGTNHLLLDQNFIAPDFIQCLYPSPGDVVEYDPLEAASTGYLGPNPDQVEWRAFDDGTTENGDQDLNGDVGAMDNVMGWLCTYFEVVSELNVEVCVGSDDGGQAWLNDMRLVSEHTCRGRGDCDMRSAPMTLAPGQYRVMVGAWNSAGGWGARLSLVDADTLAPIIDGDGRVIFHGATRPAPLSEYPDCDDVVDPVSNLECEFAGDTVVLSWLNPDPAPNPIVVTANGEVVENLAAGAQTVTIAIADLPATDPLQLCVDNGSFVPTCCSVSRNIAPTGIASQSSLLDVYTPDLAINLNLGDFTHTLAGNNGLGPAIWELDLQAPTCIGTVVVHNRDSCCGTRLRDVVVSFHDISFLEDEALDPLILEAADAPDPLWSDAIAQTEVLNPENILASPAFMTIVFDGEEPVLLEDGGDGGGAVTAQYVRITRLPDTDLSGGAGNPDESSVLSLGEVIVIEGSCGPVDDVGPFIRGDCDQDGVRNLTDGIYLLNFLFLGGPDPTCDAACDVNSDGNLNITTAVFLFNFLFLGGPAPLSPSPGCGRSSRASDLAIGCADPMGCP